METFPEYQLIRSKRKTLSLEITQLGELIVRAPLRASNIFIQDFINKKKSWIEKNQERIKQVNSSKTPKQFVVGETFLFLGENYPLEITSCALPPLSFNGSFQLSEKYISKAQKLFENWYKEQARIKVTALVNHYCIKMQLACRSIKISSAKKRWGSCSSKGDLNFSWRLILAPPFAIEYVVIHELAHLKYMNHSKPFWRLVEKHFPEWKEARQWLKDYGIWL